MGYAWSFTLPGPQITALGPLRIRSFGPQVKVLKLYIPRKCSVNFTTLTVRLSLLVAGLYQYWFPTHFSAAIKKLLEQGPLIRSNLESDVNIA